MLVAVSQFLERISERDPTSRSQDGDRRTKRHVPSIVDSDQEAYRYLTQKALLVAGGAIPEKKKN